MNCHSCRQPALYALKINESEFICYSCGTLAYLSREEDMRKIVELENLLYRANQQTEAYQKGMNKSREKYYAVLHRNGISELQAQLHTAKEEIANQAQEIELLTSGEQRRSYRDAINSRDYQIKHLKSKIHQYSETIRALLNKTP